MIYEEDNVVYHIEDSKCWGLEEHVLSVGFKEFPDGKKSPAVFRFKLVDLKWELWKSWDNWKESAEFFQAECDTIENETAELLSKMEQLDSRAQAVAEMAEILEKLTV